jgi:hypothetical protein
MFGLPLEVTERIEAEATRIWRETGQVKPPVDTQHIIRHYRINRIPSPHLEDDIEAEFDLRAEPYTLVINTKDRGHHRIRFTEAHEIGHYALHRYHLEGLFHRGIVHRESKATVVDALNAGSLLAPMEIEANAFAAALLMPKEHFSTHIKEFLSRDCGKFREHLQEQYCVSQRACELRVNRLVEACVINGSVWADSGRIKEIMPSQTVEYHYPEVATAIWQIAEATERKQYHRFPWAYMEEIALALQGIASQDAATQSWRHKDIVLSHLLPYPHLNQEGMLVLYGKNEREVYFSIYLDY